MDSHAAQSALDESLVVLAIVSVIVTTFGLCGAALAVWRYVRTHHS